MGNALCKHNTVHSKGLYLVWENFAPDQILKSPAAFESFSFSEKRTTSGTPWEDERGCTACADLCLQSFESNSRKCIIVRTKKLNLNVCSSYY